MGIRFRKSFKVAPGVRINLGKKGVGMSVGGKGFRYSVSPTGRRTSTIGIPGTGISYSTTSHKRKKKKARTNAYKQRQALQQAERNRAKMEMLERAKHEVAVYENQIEMLTAIHKEADEPVHWETIAAAEPPFTKGAKGPKELKAIAAFESYQPNFLDRLLNRLFKNFIEKKIQRLKEAIPLSAKEDQLAYQNWESATGEAKAILDGNIDAYFQVIQAMDPLGDLSEFGSGFEFSTDHPSYMEVSFDVHSEQMVPATEKKLTKTGKLSEKALTKTRYYELQQDYTCSCIIRIARDLFALLPIQTVYVHAFENILNTETGHVTRECILSVKIKKEKLLQLNLDLIDCSDSMNNFPHQMKFRKTKGFAPVNPLIPDETK